MDMPFDPIADLLGLGGDDDGGADNRPFELTAGPYVNHQLRVIGFTGEERVNDTYVYSVTFATRLAAEVVFALDGEPACLTLKGVAGHEPHLIQGIIASTSTIGSAPGERGTPRRRYRLEIVPRLWLLTQRRTIRHFQNQSPQEIVEKVLSDIGIKPKECRFRLEKEYPKLRFVYQRNETDYDFLRRILSEAGIFFYFEHASGTLDSILPGAGAGAIAGALGTVADMVGGPVADAVDEAGVATKMLSILTFSDTASHTPAVEDMAVANELAGEGLKSLASAIGGSAVADLVEENPADAIPYDDEAGAGTDKERIFAFELTKRIRPKKERILDRNVGMALNWAGNAQTKPVDVTPSLGVGVSVGMGGPSVKAHARINLDIDAPTIPPSMLRQEHYQLHAGLREYNATNAGPEPGRDRAELELARDRADRIAGLGQSDCRRLGAAYRFVLEGHPNGALDREYMVVAIRSEGWSEAGTDDARIYQNAFECIPSNLCPLPPRWPRPKLEDELARVVSQEGVRVTPVLATNRHGYVKVRFAWDVATDEGIDRGNLAYHEEYDHAVWVPVSQPWAGDGYGMQCLPREGMDVIIGFLEGQGERPYVKGCVYNERNPLPFPEELEHQKMGIRSRTIPENGGHSEISIDDQRGGELVHLRAQRDYSAVVLRESRTLVGVDALEQVGRNSVVTVGGNHSTRIGGIERRDVTGYRHDTVGDALRTKVGGSAELDVTGDLSETVRGSHDLTVVYNAEMDIAGSRRASVGVEEVVRIGQRHIVSVGDANEPGRSYMTVVDGTYRRRAKAIVLEADESLVLRAGKTELHLTPDAITMLASTIQGTASKKFKVRGEGSALQLDESADIFAKEVNLNGSGTRLQIADKIQVLTPKTLDKSTGSKVLPAQLESRYALELFERAAERIAVDEFSAWALAVFGSDIPPDAYKALHRELLAKTVQNPKIALSTKGSLGGELGAYNNKTREIHVSKDLADSAETSANDAAELFLVLLHEFGHHIDNIVRNDYSKTGGDAPGEEGAAFAYAIAGMDYDEHDHVVFGTYTHDGQVTQLKLEYPDLHQAVKEYKEEPQAGGDGKAKTVEYFGALYAGQKLGKDGKPIRPGFFAHGSIEDQALQAADPKFYCNGEPTDVIMRVKDKHGKEQDVPVTRECVRDKIYFGNWLRDNSQLCEASILKALDGLAYFMSKTIGDTPEMEAQKKQAAKGSGRRAIIDHMDGGAKKDLPRIENEIHVTRENLGVYRPEEHIDNPKGLASDQKDVDSDLRGPVAAEEWAVDPSTGIKNYIANSGNGWATTATYIQKSLEKAATAPVPERYRLFGQALHPLEDLYAHSNFVELTLRRLGHDSVFAWVGEKSAITALTRTGKSDLRLPMVTGVFGFADEVVSGMEMFLENLYVPPGAAGRATNSWSLLQDLAPSHWTIAETIFPQLKFAKEASRGLEQLKKLTQDSVQSLQDHVKRKLATVAVTVLQTAALYETAFLDNMKDPNRKDETNPTHSMLSKDHPEHPIHELAARCAIKAVTHVGVAMRDVWQGREPSSHVVDVALGYFIHPNDIFLEDAQFKSGPGELVAFIDASTKKDPGLITQLNFENSVKRFFKLSTEDRRKLAQLTEDALQGDENLVKSMLALLPQLQPSFKPDIG